MNNLILALKKRQQSKESGVAIVVALLVILILVGLVTMMLMFSLRSLEKGASIQNLNASSNAADTAIANMFSTVNGTKNGQNKELEKRIGINNAVYGTFSANEADPKIGDGQYSWRWYAEKNSETSTGTTYNIYATGYKNDPDEPEARNLKVIISSTTAEKVFYNDEQKVTYIATQGGSFAWSGLGTRSVETGEKVSTFAYDSNSNIGYPTVSSITKKGSLATTGTMKLGDQTSASLNFMGVNSTSASSALCEGSSCSANEITTLDYMISLENSRTTALSKCPSSQTYPDWIASQNGGEIAYTTANQCYNNIIFDTDTTLAPSYSTGNPAKMYARGSITVKPGVEVARQIRTPQGPYALQIVASGSTKFTMESGTVADPTKLTGVVVGQNLECLIGTPTGAVLHGTAVYGSVACNTLKVQPNTQLWRDNQLDKVLKEGSPSSKRIWSAISYDEL